MATDDPNILVSSDWLAARIGDPDLRIFDASFYLPDMGRNARAEYDAAHIPGALFFDIDEISDAGSDLPHMAPSPEKFIGRMGEMGVSNGNQVVVYDGAGLFSAARVWWLFHLMGKTDIAVLDGGLPKWQAEGRPVDNALPIVSSGCFTASRQERLVCDAAQVAAASRLGDHEILDARSPGRFLGDEKEPRAGLRSGHIPGSKNVHYGMLLNEDGTMKEPAMLRAVFDAAGVDLEKPAITTCGSGVTAAIISLALQRAGHMRHALYDGSWAEWGRHGELKVATGEA